MMQEELIEKVRRGERIHTEHSLHADVTPGYCSHKRGWRTLVCDNETDVCECPNCGAQRLMSCNFDEEFA